MPSFKIAALPICRWAEKNATPSEPHSELIIWMGVLRAVAARRPEFMVRYPEDDWLHP